MEDYNYSYDDEEFSCDECGRMITEHEYSLYKGLCSECARRSRQKKERRYVHRRSFEEGYY